MLDEADVRRLHQALPDLFLAPTRAQLVMSQTAIAMSLGVMGLALAVVMALARGVRR